MMTITGIGARDTPQLQQNLYAEINTVQALENKKKSLRAFLASIFKLAQFQLRKSHISLHLLQPIFFGNCLEAFICK